MKLYLIEKTSGNKLVNLGGKIKSDKLKAFLDKGDAILIREIDRDIQTDLRLRKVPETKKMDRGYKTIKAFYVINLEMGKIGFDAFSPKEVMNEENLRFNSLDRAINMLEAKQGLKRNDWIIQEIKN